MENTAGNGNDSVTAIIIRILGFERYAKVTARDGDGASRSSFEEFTDGTAVEIDNATGSGIKVVSNGGITTDVYGAAVEGLEGIPNGCLLYTSPSPRDS